MSKQKSKKSQLRRRKVRVVPRARRRALRRAARRARQVVVLASDVETFDGVVGTKRTLSSDAGRRAFPFRCPANEWLRLEAFAKANNMSYNLALSECVREQMNALGVAYLEKEESDVAAEAVV